MGKIAILSYSIPSDISGVTSWLIPFASFLANHEHEVVCLLHHSGLCTGLSKTAVDLSNQRVRVIERQRHRCTEDNVESVLDFLRDEKPDVFLPHCLLEGFLAGSIAGKFGLPWIMTIHSDDPDYWEPLRAVRPERTNATCVAVSEHIAEIARKKYGVGRALVIPYGVESFHSTASWNGNPFTLLYSGRVVERQKRMSLVIESMIKACRRNPNIKCRIIGDGSDVERSQSTVGEAGVRDQISFLGRLDVADVRRELGNAQAILMMSDFEGLPVALLEAMSQGVVPVARNIPSGIPELVKHRESGLLVSDDPTQAADAINELAESQSLWNECSSGALRVFGNGYRVDLCHRKWEELIQSICLSRLVAQRISIPRRFKLPKQLTIYSHPDQRRPTARIRLFNKIRSALRRIKSYFRSRFQSNTS